MKWYFLPFFLLCCTLAGYAQDSLNVSQIASLYSIWDSARDVALTGDHAYIATDESGLRVLDISDPTAPVEVAYSRSSVPALGVAIQGDYAYVAASYSGLRVIDISDPTAPVEVGVCSNVQGARNVTVDGNYACVSCETAGLQVVNISDPTNPTLTGTFSGAYIIDAAMAGSYAYVIQELQELSSELLVIDLSDPSNPTEVYWTNGVGYSRSITLSDGYVYIAAYDTGLVAYSISVPDMLFLAGVCDTPGLAIEVAVQGEYACVTDSESSLRLINVSNPYDPVETGFLDTPGEDLGVGMNGDLACVADGGSGLRLVYISDPFSLIELSAYDTPGQLSGLTLADGYLYLIDNPGGLRIVDISNPAEPVETGAIATPGLAREVTVQNQFSYIADSYSGLRIIDIGDPAAPYEVGFCQLPDISYDVAVLGDYAYVAEGSEGLRVVDVSDPAAPVEVAVCDPNDVSASFRGVYVEGDYVYAACGSFGHFYIIDISNPLNPQAVGYLDLSGNAKKVVVQNGIAYLAMSTGMRMVDVNNPSAPVEIGYLDTPGTCDYLTVADEFVFASCLGSGIRVIDVSDPSAPVETGYYDTDWYAQGVAIDNQTLFLADLHKLLVLDCSDATTRWPLDITLTTDQPLIVQPGGSFSFGVHLDSYLQTTRYIDFWTEVELPDGSLVGPIRRINNVRITPATTININAIQQDIPVNAPTGIFTYVLKAGNHPDVVAGRDEFQFEVISTPNADRTQNALLVR
ncbi:hypothetical protein KQI52_01465 [bacterium]|nr:hypothetical protein [bacterium]